jgi:hypothetical protein
MYSLTGGLEGSTEIVGFNHSWAGWRNATIRKQTLIHLNMASSPELGQGPRINSTASSQGNSRRRFDTAIHLFKFQIMIFCRSPIFLFILFFIIF